MRSVIVTGTLGYDYIMDFSGHFADRIMVDKIHRISFAPLVDRLSKQLGGTAGNIGYTLKLLGVEPLIIAPSGNDFDPYRNFLKRNHIDTSYIAMQKTETSGMYFVVTDQDDSQVGAYYRGANKLATKLSLVPYFPRATLAILAPTEPGAMKKFVRECRSKQFSYLYDPAFQIGDFTTYELREGIEGATILIGNDYEIALIEQKLGISHEELIVMVPILITTLGRKGSIIETRKDVIHVKSAKPKNETDPTGAGDAYRAGFVAGYLRGFDLSVCGQMGSVAAVYTVEKYGTMTHRFTKKEFENRYRENFGKNISL